MLEQLPGGCAHLHALRLMHCLRKAAVEVFLRGPSTAKI